MRLLFSESRPDYGHYIFPYAIWAFPDPGETPAALFASGFLPSTHALDRFYLCRQVRVDLGRFQPSSENRRILRKGEGIHCELLPREQFEYTPEKRAAYRAYAEARFGPGVMPDRRLDSLFAGRITSHVLRFTDTVTGAEVGAVTLYLEPPRMAYYYYAFYDLRYFQRNLGMFMMTAAVRLFAGNGLGFLYLGSCYSANALYKTQFAGAEFFNGVRWSDNLEELKYLIGRDQREIRGHLLEEEEYRAKFYGQEPGAIALASPFRILPAR